MVKKEQSKQTTRHSRVGGNPEDVQVMTMVSQHSLDSRLRGNDAGWRAAIAEKMCAYLRVYTLRSRLFGRQGAHDGVLCCGIGLGFSK